MTELTPSQTLRAMLCELHPLTAVLTLDDYNRVGWLLSATDEQVLGVGRWVETMWRRYCATRQCIEVENGRTR